MHELIRLERTPRAGARPLRGGLPVWQQKRVAEYIEEHLAEEISLAALAELVDLSLYHFARVFKQSFGVPPHHYHMVRRTVTLLLAQGPSVSPTLLANVRREIWFEQAHSRSTSKTAPFPTHAVGLVLLNRTQPGGLFVFNSSFARMNQAHRSAPSSRQRFDHPQPWA